MDRSCLCVELQRYFISVYLAIDDKARGNGFGSGVLGALKEKYKGRNLFLAIEEIDEKAENYAERINRKKFL